MTSPSELPSADLHSSSSGIPSLEMPSTNLEQEHLLPLVIARQFPYPVFYPDVARRRVFALASRLWDTHIRTTSQILEPSADGSPNVDNTFRPLMPNSMMRSETYLQYVYPQLREVERPPMYDYIGPSEALNLTVNETSNDRDSVTENELSMGEDSDKEEVDITGEDSNEEEVIVTGVDSDEEEVDVTGVDSDEEEVGITGEDSHDEKESSVNDFSLSNTDGFSQEHMEADAYVLSQNEEEVIMNVKKEPFQEEMGCNSDDSFCGEKFVLPVIASTSGSQQQPTAGCSQQGKHKVGRLVLIWTNIT